MTVPAFTTLVLSSVFKVNLLPCISVNKVRVRTVTPSFRSEADALSDNSGHKGANYPLAGMATTRYWANVALIAICKTSYDYQWDASKEKREYSISLWIQHWDRIKLKG